MSERKRRPLSLAQRDALIRPLWPRVTAAIIDDPLPPTQGRALFRREDIDAAIERGSTVSPAERDALLRGTFSNAPRPERAESITMETLRDMQRLLSERTIAMPQTITMSPRLYEELQRFGVPRSDDQVDALAYAMGFSVAEIRRREAATRRAAQYEREAPWRARILASIPAPRHITAAELRARVVLPSLRERLGLVTP